MNSKLIVLSILLTLSSAFAQNAEELKADAIIAFRKKEYSKSIDIWKELIKSDRSNPTYWFNLGNAFLLAEKYKNAIRSYQKVEELKSPLSLPAKIYMSRAILKLGRPYMAISKLGEIKREKNVPPNILDIYESEIEKYDEYYEEIIDRGMEAYDANDLAEARRNFLYLYYIGDESLSFLMLGSILLKQNRPKKARDFFNKIDDDEIRKEAETIWNDYEEEKQFKDIKRDRRVRVVADFAVGYDNNAYTATEVAVEEGKAKAQGSANAKYKFVKIKKSSFSIGYEIYFEKYRDDDDSKSSGNILTLPFETRWSKNFLVFTPSFEKEKLGGNPYLVKNDFGLYFQRQMEEGSWGVENTYTRYDPDQDGFFYLEGYSNYLRGFLKKDLETTEIELGLSLIRERYVDSIEVNRSFDGISFDFSYIHPLSKEWEWEFGLGITRKRYLKDFNSSFIRQDTYASIYSTISYGISDNLSAYFNLALIRNKSNLKDEDDDRNYQQAVSLFGLTWQIY